jgi:hypothetical protein
MRRLLPLALMLAAAPVFAKLPPLSDEAKAKAAEAAAKAAHGNKVADFQLCNSMNKVAARYLAEAQKAGKAATPTQTPACADPGPFVAATSVAAAPAAAAPAVAPAAPAVPAAPAAPAAKPAGK